MAIQLSLRNLEKRQASGSPLSSEQLAGLLAWPAAVVAAAPAVLPSAGHDVHGQLCMTVMPVITEHLAVLSANSGESAVHAAAQAEAHRQLPALVRACEHAAGRLAVSDGEALPVRLQKNVHAQGPTVFYVKLSLRCALGRAAWCARRNDSDLAGLTLDCPATRLFCADQYVSKEWEALLHFLALLVDTGKGYCQAAATALAAEGPGGKPGKQLAAHLLALLTSLVEAGPPASLPASEPISVPQGATGTGAAEAVAHGFNTLSGWDCLLLIVGTETFDPYPRVLTARGDVGLCLLSQLGGLLERLHEQQQRQQAASVPAALAEHAYQGQVLVIAAAGIIISRMLLFSYGTVVESLLPAAEESGRSQQLQGSLRQAAEKGLRFATDALYALQLAAAVLPTAAAALAHKAPNQTRLAECSRGFHHTIQNAGGRQMLGLACSAVS